MTIDERQDGIIEEFSTLEDWFDKYEYLIALGKQAPVHDRELRSQNHALEGCQSNVWLRAKMDDGRLRLSADSDSTITRGMLVLLLRILDNQPPADIANARLFFLDALGLKTHLSPTRANGLATILREIKRLAEQHTPPAGV